MFENIGSTIKVMAKVFWWVGTITIVGIIVFWPTSWLLYGFGELVENSAKTAKDMNNILRLNVLKIQGAEKPETTSSEAKIINSVIEEIKEEEYQEKLSSIPGKKGSDLRRKLLSCCDRQIPDKQGRILIPPQLRKHALLEKDVVVIGASNHAEIWDKKLWDEFNERVTVDDLSDALEDLVL
jgi:division/cell wall cluster transcriptional repressor MraZ